MTMDQLTGLPTHNDLPRMLTDLRGPAEGDKLCAVFVDIDALRQLSLTRGWQEVDDVLARLGGWLQAEALTLHGHVVRMAGDEFLLLLPGASMDATEAVAQKLVDGCTALRIPCEGSEDGREALAMSAVAFTMPREVVTGFHELRERLASAIYAKKQAVGRNYGVVTTLESGSGLTIQHWDALRR